MKNPKNIFAFTLIELLIVAAIISILALIGLVNLSEATNRAERVQCASNLHTIATALYSYRIDYNRYPPADGTAGTEPSPGRTEVGNGPAANGSWDGVPRVILSLHYLSDDKVLFCPVYKKRYAGTIQNFRYAYNNSAQDTGTESGGADNILTNSHDIWLCRCLWVPSQYSFKPDAKVEYPHPQGDEKDMENVLYTNGRVELSNGQNDFKKAFNL